MYSMCVCFPEQSYRVKTLKQIQPKVTVKDGPRETPQREGEREKTSNKLAASNILFIYQSLLVTHCEYIFVSCMCMCLLLCVYVCLRTTSRLLVWHVYILDVPFAIFGYFHASCLCCQSVGVLKWMCYAVYTCNISVVNLGWPICQCWYIFQSVCLVFLLQLLLLQVKQQQ